MNNEFFIVPSICDQDTFFLFRDYAIEIKFIIDNGIIRVVGRGFLTPPEIEFIKEYFL